MKCEASLIVVKDMEKSRNFYEELLDQKVVMDLGANVSYEGFALHTFESWVNFIKKDSKEINLNKTNNAELYFETEDYDKFLEKFKSFKNIEILNDNHEAPYGQRLIRFYDLDNHIIEVGESLESLIIRLSNEGMSISEITQKTKLPEELVITLKNSD